MDSNIMNMIGQQIKGVANRIVTVRTGTVVSNNVAQEKTQVVLDNDPNQIPVTAACLTYPLPKGTRVALLAYPPRGLIVIGAFSPAIPVATMNFVAFGGNSTYTKPTAVNFMGAWVMVLGGGGGGGGATTTAGNQASPAAGGEGGHASRGWIPAASIPSSVGITVGAGGTAGAAGGGSGGTGGTTAFGTLMVINGGDGGSGAGASASSAVSAGGTSNPAFSGTWGQRVDYAGQAGHNGVRVGGAVAPAMSWAGAGGMAALGKGGGGRQPTGNLGQGNAGASGKQYGGGGSGAVTNQVGQLAGGAGFSGLVEVEEVYGPWAS